MQYDRCIFLQPTFRCDTPTFNYVYTKLIHNYFVIDRMFNIQISNAPLLHNQGITISKCFLYRSFENRISLNSSLSSVSPTKLSTVAVSVRSQRTAGIVNKIVMIPAKKIKFICQCCYVLHTQLALNYLVMK